MKLKLIALAIGAAAVGVTSAAHAQGDIKIGALITLSGPAAYLGEPVQKALQLLVEGYNKNGGMNGKKLTVVTYDTEGNSGKAVQLYRRLVDSDHVVAVIGPSSTGETLSLLSVTDELKTPLISFGAGKAIVEPVHQFVFKVPPTDELEIKQLVHDFAARGIKSIAVLHEAGPYGQSGANLLKTLAPAGGITIVADEQFQVLDTDMTAQLIRVRDSHPDAVVIWSPDPAATLLVKQAAVLGVNKPIYNSPAVADPRFIVKAGTVAEGTYVQSSPLLVASELSDSSPQKADLVRFSSAYLAAFKQLPPQNAGHAYDALHLIQASFKSTDSLVTGTSLAQAMKSVKFCGANGCFQMTPTDHNGLQPNSMVILKAEQGVWRLSH